MLNVKIAGASQEPAARDLTNHPSVEKVDVKNNEMLIVTLRPEVVDYSELASMLIERGHKLILFREDELNLETAFMALTKGITS